MVWNETCAMEERMRFVTSWLQGEESIATLCRRYGVSRKTGYKWLSRYRGEGVSGLEDRSRTPHGNSRSIASAVATALIEVRQRHPHWGPRKVKAWLERYEPDVPWPAASTIGCLFDRVQLTVPRKRRRRVAPHGEPFAACRAANDVWCVDFKGWFMTGSGRRVDPLTLSDAHSRFLLRCEAVDRADEAHVWPVLVSAFREYGLPRALRSDNGPPFASLAAGGLSRLSVKLIKAGIRPERIEPGKPQQNGRHERMHLTLKQETASPPAGTLRAQKWRFARFRDIYNTERPHEALGQLPPATFYVSSPRPFDGVLRSPDYDGDTVIRRVRQSGEIKWRGKLVFLSAVLVGEPVGLTEIADDVWLVRYGPVVLGRINGKEGFRRLGSGSRSRPKA